MLDTKACTCHQDGAAVAGLAVAGLALAAVEFTGQRIWDPIGSIVVGQLLGVVCINSDHLCPWFTDVEGSCICPRPYDKSPGLPQICLLNSSWDIIFHHVIWVCQFAFVAFTVIWIWMQPESFLTSYLPCRWQFFWFKGIDKLCLGGPLMIWIWGVSSICWLVIRYPGSCI